MKRSSLTILALIAILSMTFGIAAGPIFGGLTTTADGYSTWDADMINAEELEQTGAGVYVAVLDTGLVPNWSDYFPKERIATELGTGFDQSVTFKAKSDNGCEYDVSVGKLHQTTWVGSIGSSHGTHVASTIIGYFYRSNSDAAAGFVLPPIVVRGIAPDVTIIPVKVLADYQIPALPKCSTPTPATNAVFGTDEMVAAGINYVTDLAIQGYRPMVINMSLGGSELADIEKAAIDRAVENGVVIVAAAGNEGEAGMGYPGAYAPVISAGSVGWTGEWLKPGDGPRYRMWWLKYPELPILAGTGDVSDPTVVEDVYLSDFSSRALPGQELDVLAPGSWVRGPFAGDPGYNHLPWWSDGIADLRGHNSGNFYYVGGTSMATPHVSAAAALLLQKNPTLTAGEVEAILKSTTLQIPDTGSRDIWDNTVAATITWDTDCNGTTCDPVGAGLIQLDQALAATPAQ
ncbi:subtilisin-like serine protease [Longilinea arvoryzae]|uniref:Subtilisin-like serine protease n=1 Tax=Longilinea arvoryzae TaxID=360412 RepID=A0A0S7BHB7_9CHLR|nr:S8 family serine peptidase [Longilinea arvoryzae]GAP14484.1 subtilisin-like serine protease [Longilinea arvoryzae]